MSAPLIIAIIIALIAVLLLLEPQCMATHSLDERIMRQQFRSSKHKWQKSQVSSFYFCYLCNHLTNGWFSNVLECKKCGIIIHKICRYLKYRKPQCKFMVTKGDNSGFFHQWRQSSYLSNSICSVCDQLCTGLYAYVCIWCNRTRHTLCNAQKHQCDFGPLRNHILQPTQIKCDNFNLLAQALRPLRRKKSQQVSESQNSHEEDGKIVIQSTEGKQVFVILVNKKSGGQAGNEYIKAFYRALNPIQVISILEQGLDKLKLFVGMSNLMLLVAGGDGTVCSVLNYIKQIEGWRQHNPPVAILPLGTGNDLSCTLGWGPTATDSSVHDLLSYISRVGKPHQLDRWTLSATSQHETRQFTVYNYVGFGLDAKITKHFHDIRERYPQLFFSQFANKLIYANLGAADIFKSQSCTLSQHLSLALDGAATNIDQYENIILLNIHHWGGGVELWKQAENKKTQGDYDDGKIEVVGLTDVLHMGQVQVGLDRPFAVGQATTIEIEATMPQGVLFLQIDGEPIELITPVHITFTKKDQVSVLINQQPTVLQLGAALLKALSHGIITNQQYDKIYSLGHSMQ